MQTVGITGGIGSGKSRIAQELAKRGLAVYDCDQEAKRIIAEDASVQKAIIELLGEEAFTEKGYNTAYVAKRVFAEPELLNRLNAIVHPAVKEDIIRTKPDIVESAILFEAGLDKLCDSIIVVEAPEEVRIARVIARDYKGEATADNIEKVRARMCAQKENGQWTMDNRQKRIYRITNDGKASTESIVTEILELQK